jgi:hypothetical protein
MKKNEMTITAIRTGYRVRRITRKAKVPRNISQRQMSKVVKALFGLTNYKTRTIDTWDTFMLQIPSKDQTIQVYWN